MYMTNERLMKTLLMAIAIWLNTLLQAGDALSYVLLTISQTLLSQSVITEFDRIWMHLSLIVTER